jgi:hypothetical protein
MGVESLTIKAGTRVWLGKPAKPMRRESVERIAAVVRGTPGILEAHLPQCYAEGVMTGAAQVLVLVLPERANPGSIVGPVTDRLGSVLGTGEHLDVWHLMPDSPMLEGVRNAGCNLEMLAAVRKSWWKFR